MIDRRTFAGIAAALTLPSMPAAANEPDVAAFNALAQEVQDIIRAAPIWLQWLAVMAIKADWQAYRFEKTEKGVVVAPTEEMLTLLACLRAGSKAGKGFTS